MMKRAVVVRYGGIGDMFQASSILPGLKADGYRVVINTTPAGQNVLRHDPHVDDWIIQQPGEIPNEKLADHWRHIASRCDRFINLCESVEGTVFPVPGRPLYYWPAEARRLVCGSVDVIELTHRIARVPGPPKYRFYPTFEEKEWAKRQYTKIGGRVILWVLSGSSVHKFWPYSDQIIARIMLALPDVRVVLVGEEAAKILEIGWENEPRVITKSGKWSVRKTLAFAREADLVIAPETGIPYSIGLFNIPKIILLSHSSPANLYNHWAACTAIEPKGCECYPCHQLHYGWDPCRQDEATGAAVCQAMISSDSVWQAVLHYLSPSMEKRRVVAHSNR